MHFKDLPQVLTTRFESTLSRSKRKAVSHPRNLEVANAQAGPAPAKTRRDFFC